jgi:hypothetical protein
MNSNPFFRSENNKFFPDFIEHGYFIFTIFEAKGIVRKIQFLHVQIYKIDSVKILFKFMPY